MRVRLDNRDFWIEFRYQAESGDQREVTTCLLRDGSALRGKDKEAPVIAQGRVCRYFKDPPNREAARKAALTKALDTLDSLVPVWPSARFLAKSRRRLFWEAYLHRKKPAGLTLGARP